ncbi:MAG: Asp-tRNA(Asn)/Glu-tRNA(Gln) amidotransferase GatCAB subunit A [Nitrospirae bacterium CG18_big_fil_WC_8_21_14_2_50_70_55]|nr:Asp-tRNA(Asn)/Glu-tRNA(Gln) amidotransferase subunit GatA [Deltaproteobacteria bacterium]OIP65938.1 MAG: aspartyl/glutamyl-tRNA amidotransferase subunit A [Nitrospirae bacterium CG2_30_70_394]PIQ03604.1 MAG: Asp-tRNA(Asn)/Glu-tRNA(Gln) amidotransferase GatCAB subunit A [Nitrospirae bacterium CG18_big_fil_WC_8_21_14_2_50_70_55]PIU79315.1 MAG: Asp-tRNA(Asn)/Glu-tRNA(Gln) amidotransferase GatCAB subunit A [Nitrospirae bacterium CG06_land_8_20_14_3_00_70_43]PIW83371.1 MAG: Asp-tRNA(Asn)/Glu-tRNA
MAADSDLARLTLHEAGALLAANTVTSTALTEACLARIAAVEGSVHAFAHLTVEVARAQARARDQTRPDPLPPLWGLPIALKDNICTRGLPTTCGSRLLANFRPVYDSFVARRLEEAGAVILGKTNMDEFAMGSSCENSALGPTHNPHDLTRVPGGSSGGSAAATAADECLAALGSDTGGSIRQPACFCGVVGLKPTYGRVSRNGLVAFASSLDQIGPITKDARDAALLLAVIAGHDADDSTSAREPVPDYVAGLDVGVAGLRIGLPKEYLSGGLDPEVEQAVGFAIATYERLGATTVEVSLPHTEHAVATYYLVATAEASSNLGRFDGIRYGVRHEGHDLLDLYQRTREAGFGAEVKRRIMLGTFALSAGYYAAYYGKAMAVRTLIRNDFTAAFERCDVLLTPTAPTPPFCLGEKLDDPLTMYLSDIFTIAVSLAGLPAVAFPCGATKQRLPLGAQLIGRPFDEGRLLAMVHAFEAASGQGRMAPAL